MLYNKIIFVRKKKLIFASLTTSKIHNKLCAIMSFFVNLKKDTKNHKRGKHFLFLSTWDGNDTNKLCISKVFVRFPCIHYTMGQKSKKEKKNTFRRCSFFRSDICIRVFFFASVLSYRMMLFGKLFH